MEILITITLIAIVGSALLILLNPSDQTGKSYDARRKKDLDTFRKTLEDYYNDHGCYPQPEAVCYDSAVTICKSKFVAEGFACHICGLETTSPHFKPYLDPLICDPQQPKYKYLYEVEGDNKTSCAAAQRKTCPQWYILYSVLYKTPDKQVKGYYGFREGSILNPPSDYNYPYGHDYYVSANKGPNYPTSIYCITKSNSTCDNCGSSYLECTQVGTLCKNDKFYATKTLCCAAGGTGCPR